MTTTAAGAIKELLTRFQSVPRESGGTALAVIARTMGVKEHSQELLDLVFQFHQRCEEVRASIPTLKMAPDVQRDAMSTINAVSGLLNLAHLHQPWLAVHDNYLKHDLIIRLGFVDATMRHALVVEMPEAEPVSKLIDDISQLIGDLKSAEIDEDLKEHLVDALLRVSFSLQNYRLFGAKGVNSSIEFVIGALVRRHADLAEIEKQEGSPIAGIRRVVAAGIQLFNTTVNTAKNIEYVRNVLDNYSN
jgi:hypothetical protein